MPTHAIRARPPHGGSGGGMLRRDPDLLSGFLEDAAHFPGGHAEAIAAPSSEGDVADILRPAPRVLPIGAQSSLTGGATPMGDVLITTSRFNRIVDVRE